MGYFETVDAIERLHAGQGFVRATVPVVLHPHDAMRQAVSGLSLLSPDAVLDHMNEVKAQIQSLHQDIVANAPTLGSSYVNNWSAFTERWRAWYETNSAWSPRFFGPGEIDAQATLFQKETADFWNQFEQATGKKPFQAMPVAHEAADRPSRGPDLGLLGWGLLGVLGLFGAAYLVKAIRT